MSSPADGASFIGFLGAAANFAATKIQAAFRGYQIRKDLEEKRGGDSSEPRRDLPPPELWAAYQRQLSDGRKLERPPIGTMRLVVVSAENLYNAQCCFAQDPYVKLTYGKTIHKTQPDKSGRINPTWHGQNSFDIFVPDNKDTDSARIACQVLNSNIFSDDLLGSFDVDITNAANNAFAPEFSKKFDVQSPGRGLQGSVLVRCRFILPVSFKVVEAKDLYNVQLIGKQDPYCILTWSGRLASGEKNIKKTKIHEDGGSTPKWNETISFAVGDDIFQQPPDGVAARKARGDVEPLPSLEIEVWDENVLVDKVIAHCVITYEQMIELRVKEIPYWINLYKGRVADKGKEPSGKLQLAMPRLF